jgi:hypothetical protein
MSIAQKLSSLTPSAKAVRRVKLENSDAPNSGYRGDDQLRGRKYMPLQIAGWEPRFTPVRVRLVGSRSSCWSRG